MSKRRKKTDEFELEIRDYYSGDIPKIWKWRPQDKSLE